MYTVAAIDGWIVVHLVIVLKIPGFMRPSYKSAAKLYANSGVLLMSWRVIRSYTTGPISCSGSSDGR
jgi:hypothetical protein